MMRDMRALRSFSVALGMLGAIAAACADAPPSREGTSGPSGADDPEVRYRATATVIDDGERGPVLCVGGVADSLPPQCSGVPLVGWDWNAVAGEESASGQRWGDYRVVGTYDGERFAVSEVSPGRWPPSEPIDWMPCDEPADGWISPDPARTTDDDRVAAMRVAEDADDSAGFWIDEGGGEGGVTVIVAAFTGDPVVHEADLRAVWGGPICLVRHERTLAELTRIQRALSDPAVAEQFGIQTTWSATDVLENHVEQGVIVATDEAREAVAERYGEAAVELVPALVPVDAATG